MAMTPFPSEKVVEACAAVITWILDNSAETNKVAYAQPDPPPEAQ